MARKSDSSKNEYAERAKIFIPFDTLKGFQEALREKEKVLVSKKKISQEIKEQISLVLSSINKNDMVKVVYYCNGEYILLQGIVSRIDITYQELQIVTTKIMFDDIFEIEKIED